MHVDHEGVGAIAQWHQQPVGGQLHQRRHIAGGKGGQGLEGLSVGGESRSRGNRHRQVFGEDHGDLPRGLLARQPGNAVVRGHGVLQIRVGDLRVLTQGQQAHRLLHLLPQGGVQRGVHRGRVEYVVENHTPLDIDRRVHFLEQLRQLVAAGSHRGLIEIEQIINVQSHGTLTG